MTNVCPACNGRGVETVENGVRGLFRCETCGAVFGHCYLGDSYLVVHPVMTSEDVPTEHMRYYDLECLGSRGLTRRHGWFDNRHRTIVQVG